MAIFDLDSNDVALTLNGFPLYGVDDHGVEWHTTFSKTAGIFDGVGSTIETEKKVWGDGAFGNVPFHEARAISIEGELFGACPPDLIAAWDDLKQALTLGDSILQIQLGDIRRRCTVRQSSSAPLVKWAGKSCLQFSIGLQSLSAYLFGEDELTASTGLPRTVGGMTFPYTFEGSVRGTPASSTWVFSETVVSGSIVLTNSGNASSPVDFRIDGEVTNPQFVHIESGRVMRVNGSIAGGHYVTFNGETHEILVDGADPARGIIPRREWSMAVPGTNTWRFSADSYSDTATLTASFREAYL